MIPAISLKSTICCSGWQLAGAAISKASFEVPFSPPCWGALKDIAGRVYWQNVEYQIRNPLIFDYWPHNWERCVEFYLVAQAIVKCWDQPRIPDLFQGLGEGPVQGPVHQNLTRDRESKFITYVHRCFLCFVLKHLLFFWCRLLPWQWAYLSCMVNLKWFSRFSSPISFFPSWNSPSSGFPSSFCPVFTRHFFSKMVHAEIFWVANSGALR